MIKLVAINSKFPHTNIAVRYLKDYAVMRSQLDPTLTDIERAKCNSIAIYESNINIPYLKILENILRDQPEIIAFSCYIFNIELVRKLIIDIRKLCSAEIILGGIEVSYDYEEYLPLCDHLIVGEGEQAFYDIITGKTSAKVVEGEPLDMSLLPTLVTSEYLSTCKNHIMYYESSRGCPFKCSYCMSSLTNGCRYLGMDRVEKELREIAKANLKVVKFVDRTFNASLPRAKKIFALLGELDTTTTFHCEIAGDIFDDELFSILATLPKARVQFEIGVQTFNPDSFTAINRHYGEKLCDNIRKIISLNNIHTHIDLIVGLPKEDFTSFRNSFNLAYALGAHQLQVGFLKLLKGTSLRNDSVRYTTAPPYEILSNDYLTYEEIAKLKNIEKMVDYYYNDRKYTFTFRLLAPKFDSPFDMLLALSENYSDLDEVKSVFNKITELYNFATKFCEPTLVENCLRADYLITCKDTVLKPPLISSPDKSCPHSTSFRQNLSFDPRTFDRKACVLAIDYLSYDEITRSFAYKID